MKSLAVVLFSMLTTAHLRATLITVDLIPSSFTVTSGQALSTDVFVSGLGASSPPSVGSFDVTVIFDPTLLTATGLTFGPFLGSVGSGEVLVSSTTVPGKISVAAVSLLTPAELDALQPASFSLASLSFVASASGSTALNISSKIVGDAFGDDLVVPEPRTFLLLSVGLGAALLRKRLFRTWRGSDDHR
jgi:hypothetical protein